MAQTKTKRKRSKTSSRACINCPAPCCHDLVIPTNKPRTESDIDEMKWHLQYDTVRVAVRSYRWYIAVRARCMYLNKNNRCSIYEKRPERCRRHMPPDCEKYGEWYDVLLSTPEELEDYLNNGKKY